MRLPRVAKSGDRLVADLESHIKFLRESVDALSTEPDRYKQVAAGLRVLVCEFGSNRPLLLDLMDELGVSHTISPLSDLPFPLIMADEFEQQSDIDLSSLSPDEIWAHHRSKAKSYPLREFVARGMAVYVGGHAYTHLELIRTLAEQSGLAHEDRTIDQNVPELESCIIGGYQGHVVPLRALSNSVIAAAVAVVNVAASAGYQPAYLVIGDDGRYVLPPLRDVA